MMKSIMTLILMPTSHPNPALTIKQKHHAEASDPSLPNSYSNKSTFSHITEPESFCNNCHNKPDNLDMDLPPPIHEPSLIRECPSPISMATLRLLCRMSQSCQVWKFTEGKGERYFRTHCAVSRFAGSMLSRFP